MVASGIFYGLIPQYFHPGQTGRGYTMPRVLKELEAHRDDFTIFSGLDHNIGGGRNTTKFFQIGKEGGEGKE